MSKGFKRRNNGKSQLEFDLNQGSKKCSKCKEIKKISDFSFSKTRNSYLSKCKPCRVIDTKISLSKPEIKLKKQNYMKQYNKEYNKNNYIKKYHKEYHKKYPQILTPEQKERKKEYRKRNKEHIKLIMREYFRKRRKIPIHKINYSMSSAIRKILGKSKNGRKWETLVGYTKNDLEKHLESLFLFGMSWDNYGYGHEKWVVDHILPKELFEYNSPTDKQFEICWSLKNLQPLWHIENDKKSDYLPDGRRARNLTKEEKLDYLESLGYKIKTPDSITEPDAISC